MIRARVAARELKMEAPRVYRKMQHAYRDGHLLDREFDFLLERLILAEKNNDGIYTHNAPGRTSLTSPVQALRKIKSDLSLIMERSWQLDPNRARKLERTV
jgi:hypothetical protein